MIQKMEQNFDTLIPSEFIKFIVNFKIYWNLAFMKLDTSETCQKLPLESNNVSRTKLGVIYGFRYPEL